MGNDSRPPFLFLLGALQTCFFPGLRAPNLRPLSERAERGKRHAKGEGVSIRLPLWKPYPHRPRRGLRPPPLDSPPGADETACADQTMQFSPAPWNGSAKRKTVHPTCTNSAPQPLYAQAERDRSMVLFKSAPNPSFSLHRARRVSFSPVGRKRNGGRIRPP